jgi:basic membrane protein A
MLGACGHRGNNVNNAKKDKVSVALITGGYGVDDNSFGQMAWSGIKKYGKEYNLSKGVGGYNYFQGSSASDYETEMEQAAQANYHTIIAAGFEFAQAIQKASQKYPNKKFVLIDSQAKGKNVASVMFKSQEASFLAGVAAAKTSKTGKLGWIGAVKSEILSEFESGFVQGAKWEAKKLHKNVSVDRAYIGSFTDTSKEKSVAQAMYSKGIDVISQASGGASQGLFVEANDINAQKTSAQLKKSKVWAMGVDSDQHALGNFKTKDGKKDNSCLTSIMTRVDTVSYLLAKKAAQGKFPGGKYLKYGLKENAVSLNRDYISDSAWADVQEAKNQILSDKIKVASSMAQLK